MYAYLTKYKPNSLFYKLLFHFFVVILLLSTYNVWSLTYYTSSMDDEVVIYNRTLIHNTVDSLEKQFTIWQGLMLNLQFDDRVQKLDQQGRAGGKAALDYKMVDQVISQLRALSSHPSYLFENVMVHYKQLGYLLDKESLIDADRMFSHYYESDYYPLDYWLRKEGLTSDLTLSPARQFRMHTAHRNRTLMPVEMNFPGSSWSIIALVNIDRWYSANQGIADSQLFILKDSDTALYQTAGDADVRQLPEWDGSSQWLLHEDTYYFYEKGDQTGYTYVTTIPRTRMNAKISSMNWMAIGLLTLTLLIGVIASLFFSRSINRPLKRMMTGFGSLEPTGYKSSIREFDAIYEQISGLLQEKEGIARKLTSSNSLLTHYSYMAHLKNLYLHVREAKDQFIADGSYLVVVHQLRFRSGSMPATELDSIQSRTTGLIGDLIDVTIRDVFPVSYTIQMESDQLLSVLYTNERSKDLSDCLNEVKRILDHDTDYYRVTIAVSSLISSSSLFHQAYEEATTMLTQARPGSGTIILWELEDNAETFSLTVDHEQALLINLSAGNEEASLRHLNKLLDEARQKEITTVQLHQLAESVFLLARRALEQQRVEADHEYEELLTELEDCMAFEDYEHVLNRMLADTADVIRRKREDGSDLLLAVKSYLEERYAEDISLELLADQLGLTPNYLSMSIKERTGKTFSEQLNEIRVGKAKELLEFSKISIQEVGERIGYRNATSFNRMFKKGTGMTPGDYRKAAQRRG
ncbi:helix-turn-helix domain-containing protein [Paenibacillus dakarensis]|uniref:helix-turn-helix domain-containing protein n=1 Tax=Paenibacillus dakarensis TaxID=1527293 RepID=UPI0006D53D92|nr:helix-turn-helix domain-containing protein [Paenibacillus dakarensis]